MLLCYCNRHFSQIKYGMPLHTLLCYYASVIGSSASSSMACPCTHCYAAMLLWHASAHTAMLLCYCNRHFSQIKYGMPLHTLLCYYASVIGSSASSSMACPCTHCYAAMLLWHAPAHTGMLLCYYGMPLHTLLCCYAIMACPCTHWYAAMLLWHAPAHTVMLLCYYGMPLHTLVCYYAI